MSTRNNSQGRHWRIVRLMACGGTQEATSDRRESAVGHHVVIESSGGIILKPPPGLQKFQFRGTYTFNTSTGEYHTNSPSPTNIPNDPPLAAYGVQQSRDLATALVTLNPPIEIIYSSPFYRCLETIEPTAEVLGETIKVKVDNGIGEFYGPATFHHPSPASLHLLSAEFFPALKIDPKYTPSLIPPPSGETIAQLHDRVACALNHIITSADAETEGQDTAILICTHAATLIAIGRCLTGRMPDDVGEDDFLAPCAGITKFLRRDGEGRIRKDNKPRSREPQHIEWRNGNGVQGSWDCVMNGDCGHLAGGAERTWHFSGEETFGDPDPAPAALKSESVNGSNSTKDTTFKL
ncbi:MAG: hypothetical protein L6R41_005126 [Letrouitia leprolyta]|nr:MAG: hypothetical protein L6R41_005126 [Letrouitia leprolyta]